MSIQNEHYTINWLLTIILTLPIRPWHITSILHRFLRLLQIKLTQFIYCYTPQILVDLIHTHTNNFNRTKSLMLNFMLTFQNSFYTIWLRHTDSMANWEKTQGINNKRKNLRWAQRRKINKKLKIRSTQSLRWPSKNSLPSVSYINDLDHPFHIELFAHGWLE